LGFAHLAAGDGFLYFHTLGAEDTEPLLTTGMLFIVEKGVEGARTAQDLADARIAKSISMIINAAAAPVPSLYAALLTNNYTPELQLRTDFSVLNSVNGELVPVGMITLGKYVANGTPMVFPGGTP
jgi:hypothetical protein